MHIVSSLRDCLFKMNEKISKSLIAAGFARVGQTHSHLFAPIFFTLVPLTLEQHLGLAHGEIISLIVISNALFGFAAPLYGWLADRW
ncbi:MAG: hypothetical protein CBB68_04305 [Rhodospirillaceae bacterium TMED8]|nr:hypothetical protein [Magnetovibrio sp.]OUT51557.1 MAG: hypothetical protein CBB68_04305 [Rhodospirillaceae bacterium TMED8]|tara:strand:+ start:2034 stop:2294 length:261 start_codon:yes stop_codon:yes gene_type:complete